MALCLEPLQRPASWCARLHDRSAVAQHRDDEARGEQCASRPTMRSDAAPLRRIASSTSRARVARRLRNRQLAKRRPYRLALGEMRDRTHVEMCVGSASARRASVDELYRRSPRGSIAAHAAAVPIHGKSP